MAHYAKVLNGKVMNVIAAEQDFIDTFVEKQDTFVSTTIRMLIMFAIDILSV